MFYSLYDLRLKSVSLEKCFKQKVENDRNLWREIIALAIQDQTSF